MEKENLKGISVFAKVNQLIRSGDTYREIDDHENITCLMVMGDYFVEMTLDKKTRELKGMEIKEDSETLLKYFGENVENNAKAA